VGETVITGNGHNLAIVNPQPAPLPPAHVGRQQAANDSILEIVWRQRSVVGIAVGACLILSLLYLLVATRYYSGYASLYVQQVSSHITGNAQEVRPMQDPEAFLYTQREVIASTPVVAIALNTPGLKELKTFEGEDNLFQFLKKNLSVEVGKKDEILSISFDTPYREDAQKIVAAVVDAYKNYQSKSRHSSSGEALAVFQQQKQKRDEELKLKRAELTALRAKTGMISGEDQKSNAIRQKLEMLSTALTQQQLETINAKSAWEDVGRTILADPKRKKDFEKYRASASYQNPSAQDDATLRTEMLRHQALLQEYSTRYGAAHPVMKQIQAKIDNTNVFYAAAVYRRYESAIKKEADLQTEFNSQQQMAVSQNVAAVQDTQLAADVVRLQQLSDELDKQIKNLAILEAAGAPNINVMEPPSVSRRPTRPYTGRTLALALIGGLIIGCGVACVRDWYDYRLRSADEVKSSLGITVLGLIPHVDDENSPIARGQKIHIDPQSVVAEAYRSLRTAVYFGTKERQARTILVTSPERGDGKTTMASNLAISMAQAGRRTLMIDADMRAPMQDLIFGINGRAGLATVLQGKATPDEVIRHTGIENLDLLPAGVAARNPSELLNNQKFIELIESLAEKYDQVVIDSPPLLAVTDARIVAASTDATLLVLRAGKSNRKLSELSVDGLMSVGANLLGAVVNDIRRRSYKSYGSYGTYGRYGGYGDNNGANGGHSNGDANGHETAQHVMTDDDANYSAYGSEDPRPARGRLTG
jgi:capsular exopolysaccharide synthesis family protein